MSEGRQSRQSRAHRQFRGSLRVGPKTRSQDKPSQAPCSFQLQRQHPGLRYVELICHPSGHRVCQTIAFHVEFTHRSRQVRGVLHQRPGNACARHVRAAYCLVSSVIYGLPAACTALTAARFVHSRLALQLRCSLLVALATRSLYRTEHLLF